MHPGMHNIVDMLAQAVNAIPRFRDLPGYEVGSKLGPKDKGSPIIFVQLSVEEKRILTEKGFKIFSEK